MIISQRLFFCYFHNNNDKNVFTCFVNVIYTFNSFFKRISFHFVLRDFALTRRPSLNATDFY